jgi:hypothetical protein
MSQKQRRDSGKTTPKKVRPWPGPRAATKPIQLKDGAEFRKIRHTVKGITR